MVNFNLKDDRKKNILSILNNFYLLTIGIGWVMVILYLRILLERPEYTFASIKEHLSFRHYLIFSIFVIIQIIICIIAILTLIKRKKNYEPSSLFYKISNMFGNILDFIYWKPLEYIHDKIAPHIPFY